MIEWEPTWRESGSGVYYNFSIIFLYLYSNFEGTTFRNVFVLVIVVDRDCVNLFQNTRIIFSCGEWVGWKSKNIYLFFFIYYH